MNLVTFIKNLTLPLKAAIAVAGIGIIALVSNSQTGSTVPAAATTPVANAEAPPADEALFLLYAIDSTYRNWPKPGSDPAWVKGWIGSTRVNLSSLNARAWQVDESIGVLFYSCDEMLKRYEAFLDSNHLIQQAAEQQRESDSWWLSLELHIEGATMKSGHYAASICGALMTLIRAGVEANKLSEAEAQILAKHLGILEQEFSSRVEHMRKVATKLAANRDWSARDANFEDASEGRPRDPFLIMEEVARKSREVEQDESGLFGMASDCLQAEKNIPPAKEYDPLRAQVMLKAARHANQMCANQISNSYSNAPAKSADFAINVSETALTKSSGTTTETDCKVELARSLAMGGRFADALDQVEAIEGMDQDASFLYRKARLQSLTGRPQDAVETLKESMAAGFCDIDTCRDDNDLKAIRDLDSTAFSEMLTPSVSHKVIKGQARHDISLTNTSLFRINNLKFTCKARWENGEEEMFTVTIPSLAPGESYLWENVFSTWFHSGGIVQNFFVCDQSDGS